MYFVTVGTHRQQFNRLLEKIDALVEEGKIAEAVFAQTGNSTYAPKNFKFRKFLDDAEYEDCIKKASLVISHAGAGAIINSLKNGKKMIVVPRLKKFGEHTNDHQIDLAKAMEREGKIIASYEIGDLESAIKKSRNFTQREGEKTKIINALENFAGRC